MCCLVHRYEGCLSILKKLVELRQEDARVTHNKAVAEYLLSNLTKTDEFRKTLQNVEIQFEKDAESNGTSASTTEKSVLLFNKALIHHRVCLLQHHHYNYYYNYLHSCINILKPAIFLKTWLVCTNH